MTPPPPTRTPPKGYEEMLESIRNSTLFPQPLQEREYVELELLLALVLLTLLYTHVKPLRYVSYRNGVEAPNDALQIFMGIFFVSGATVSLATRFLSKSPDKGQAGFFIVFAFMCFTYLFLAKAGKATYRGFNNERVSSAPSSAWESTNFSRWKPIKFSRREYIKFFLWRSINFSQQHSSSKIRRGLTWLLELLLWLLSDENDSGFPYSRHGLSRKDVYGFRELCDALSKESRKVYYICADLQERAPNNFNPAVLTEGLSDKQLWGRRDKLQTFAIYRKNECIALLDQFYSSMEDLLTGEYALCCLTSKRPESKSDGALDRLYAHRINLRKRLLIISLRSLEWHKELLEICK